jgi:rhodanese-related sulfurtransferase
MQFVLNNWHLFVALGVVLGLLASTALMPRLYGIKSLNVAEAVRLINHEQGVVVDVCEPAEYRGGHIPNAISAPLSAIKTSLGVIDKHKGRPVIVACRSGNRSIKGAILLRKHGFERVYSLSGGLMAWQRDNLPLAKG